MNKSKKEKKINYLAKKNNLNNQEIICIFGECNNTTNKGDEL